MGPYLGFTFVSYETPVKTKFKATMTSYFSLFSTN